VRFAYFARECPSLGTIFLPIAASPFAFGGLSRIFLAFTSLTYNPWQTISIYQWWEIMTNRKDLASITLLISWEI
jgi:chloramphenicol 3-O-phosphotransferase